jgi:hypothetical protein
MPFILTSLAAGCLIIPGVAALEPAAGVKPNIVMHLGACAWEALHQLPTLASCSSYT